MKKFFTYVVVVATIVSTLGLTAIVPAASAASTGDLIKVAGNPAVYYVNGSSKHLFSTEKTFWTWYSGTWANNPVKTVSQSEFDGLTTGANVIARAGSVIKFDNSPKVYVVGANGTLYNITEETAKAWYGNDYASKVNTIQSSFEANYSKSSEMPTKAVDGMLVKYAGSEDVYLIQDGKKRMVTDEGFTANKFKDSSVVTIPASMTFSNGSSVTGVEAGIWNVAGKASTGSSDNGTITTVGQEGTIEVSLASKPAGTVKVQEGQNKVALLGFEVEANDSDVLVERVKIGFNTTASTVWKKVVETLYLYDGSTLLATIDLQDAVNENDSEDSVTITGFSALVKENQTKTFTIKADMYSTIDSDYEGDTFTIRLFGTADNAVRAIDGAGIDQYAGGNTVTKNFTVEAPDVDNASLKIALASGNPDPRQVIATEGSDDDQIDEVDVLKFTVEAEDDDILITDIENVAVVDAGGSAVATTAYLYNEDGDLIDSASISSDQVDFTDIDYSMSKDSKETFTLKIDVEDAASTATTFTASVTAANFVAENTDGDAATVTGSATGEALTVLDAGAEITLTNVSVTKGATASQNNTTTSTVTSIFTFKLKAVDADVVFGTTATATPAFGTTTSFGIYKDSVKTTFNVASSTSYATNPSNTTSVSGGFELADGNETTVTVTHVYEGRTVAGAQLALGSYAVGLENVKYSINDGASFITTNFMAGEEAWRTSSVQLP